MTPEKLKAAGGSRYINARKPDLYSNIIGQPHISEQKVAQTIYDRLEGKAIKMGTKILTADVSKTARPFFEKQGFVVSAENRHFIRGVWITNFRMEKELSIHSVQSGH